MKIIYLLLALVLTSAPALALDITSTNGQAVVTSRTLAQLNTAADVYGMTVHVRTPQVVTTAISWRSDAALVFDQGGFVNYTGATKLTGLRGRVPVEAFGLNTTPGTTDMTTAMVHAHNSGAKVVYGPGTYKFTGPNLDFSGGIEVDPLTVFTNGRYTGIIQFDRSGALIGLMHNHMELKYASNPIPAITTGNIVAPPTGRTTTKSPVDVIAYWYQDFGLDYTRTDTGDWTAWYTWAWNHTDNTSINLLSSPPNLGYLPSRHPLLGWYRGDDQNVLDWQCYWLKEAGVSAVVVQGRNPSYAQLGGGWGALSNVDNWIYKLVNTVPNAAGLGIIPWVYAGNYGANYGVTGYASSLATAWDQNASIISNAGRQYTVTSAGKRYIVVFLWDGESLRGDLDGYSGAAFTNAFLMARAANAQSLGYDGIAVMARNGTANAIMNRGGLLANGVLYFDAAYGATTTVDGATYPLAVTAYNGGQTTSTLVTGVQTEALATNHTGGTQTGSTPALFQQMMSKAISIALKTPNRPKIVTIYNVSEWAEGGAGLQPTRGNGWGYLDAVRNALNAAASPAFPQETYLSIYNPSTAIPTASARVGIASVYNGQPYNLTPVLVNGTYEGQAVTVLNWGTYTAALPDNSQVAGSKLYFRTDPLYSAGYYTLQPNATATFMWFPSLASGAGGWVKQ